MWYLVIKNEVGIAHLTDDCNPDFRRINREVNVHTFR